MIRTTYILLLSCLISVSSVADNDDTLVWSMYAPVERSTESGLTHIKTYFFDANPGSSKTQNIDKLKAQHDSLAKIAIGKVFMRELPDNTGLGKNVWYWWAVREQGKTYLQCYVWGTNSTGTANHSYYDIVFADGTTYKWAEPKISPYNFSHMFVLLDGNMEAADPNTKELTTVKADKSLYDKAMQTPIHYITKYDGFAKEDGSVEYFPTMQYVFNKKESEQLLKVISQLHKEGAPIIAVK